MPHSVAVGYQGEDEDNKVFQNVGMLLQQYTVSQPIRP